MIDVVTQFALAYGLLGLFLAAIFLNASILLPLPFDIIFVIIAGLNVYNPLVLGLVAGLGAAIGEMFGYAFGFFGSKVIAKLSRGQMQKVYAFEKRIKDLGTVFIFVGALVPFPFDLIGVAAGIIKFDWKRFFVAVLCGRSLRYVLIAVAISFGIDAIKGLFGIV